MNLLGRAAKLLLAALASIPIAFSSVIPADAAQPQQRPTSAAGSDAAPASPAGGAAQPGAGSGFGMGRLAPDAKAAAAPRTMAPYFVPAAKGAKAPDADGFLRRWLLLEPIDKPNRTNAVFTDTYVRKALTAEYFAGQFSAIPRNGETVTAGDQRLVWHALDATNFDVKLFNFAYGLNKQTYGVIFRAFSVVESPREIEGVHMAVGSNSASMWWLNGVDVVDLFNDRRMVMDDVVSAPLTLHKGRNIIRGAVINGPGLSDFCVRFIDDDGKPIKDITQTVE